MSNLTILALLYLIPLCIGGYVIYLIIKALRIYIRKNS